MRSIPAYGLDGDNIRTGLNKNLGFAPEDRNENIRHISAEGWATPLSGFMSECEYLQCLHFGDLLDGGVINQYIPIVLPVHTVDKERLQSELAITPTYENKPVAVVRNPEFDEYRKEEISCHQFGTSHPKHPYIKIINESGDWLCGGYLEVL